jgi:hypothetical protein
MPSFSSDLKLRLMDEYSFVRYSTRRPKIISAISFVVISGLISKISRIFLCRSEMWGVFSPVVRGKTAVIYSIRTISE